MYNGCVESACLIYIVCVCLRIEVSNTCFCFAVLRLVYPILPVTLDCPFCYYPFDIL